MGKEFPLYSVLACFTMFFVLRKNYSTFSLYPTYTVLINYYVTYTVLGNYFFTFTVLKTNYYMYTLLIKHLFSVLVVHCPHKSYHILRGAVVKNL